MSDFRFPHINRDLIVRSNPLSGAEMIQKANLRIKNAGNSNLLEAIDRNKIVVRDNPFPPGNSGEHVFLNPSNPYVENKGELRFIKPDFVHPSLNFATFTQWDSGMWIWLYGLTAGMDYSAKLKLQGFVADYYNPKASDNGMFLISANADQFSVKPTFEEQVIPIGFVDVKSTNALIYLRADDTIDWNFLEINVIQTKL